VWVLGYVHSLTRATTLGLLEAQGTGGLLGSTGLWWTCRSLAEREGAVPQHGLLGLRAVRPSPRRGASHGKEAFHIHGFRYPRSMGFPRAVAHTILMRIALYARVSLKDGRRDCENHLIQLREFCLRSGRTVLDEYKEHLR
jgi:hypothetical protein